MKKNRDRKLADDDMRPEYDLRGGVRGKYYERYKQGTNVVLLEPDIAKLFLDSAMVNNPDYSSRKHKMSKRARHVESDQRVTGYPQKTAETRPG